MTRLEQIARVIEVWPHEVAETREARMALCQRMRKRLRAERRRELRGDWTADLGRHGALLHLYRRELDALKRRRPS